MKGAACLVGAAAIGPVAGAVERISLAALGRQTPGWEICPSKWESLSGTRWSAPSSL